MFSLRGCFLVHIEHTKYLQNRFPIFQQALGLELHQPTNRYHLSTQSHLKTSTQELPLSQFVYLHPEVHELPQY